MEKNKINFFSRIKRAVIKFDDYEFFIEERLRVAIGYMLKLILLISIIVGAVLSYVLTQGIQDIYSNVLNYIPDFKFQDYQITEAEIKESVNTENDLYFCVDASEEIEEEKLNQYLQNIEEHALGIVFLKDKFIYKSNEVIEYPYKDLMTKFNIENITFNKEEAIRYIDENIMNSRLYVIIFIWSTITFFMITTISVISDAILLWLLGIITARLARLKLKYSAILTVAIYSLTLPLILLAMYDIVTTLTSFRIDYFNIIYISIAYIYVIAAILMIKSDLIKQNIELTKIVEVQAKLKEELEEDKEQDDKENKKEPEDKEKDKDKDEDEGLNLNNNEPNGSEI